MTRLLQHIEVERFQASEGCSSYLIIDPHTKSALVLDPRLDQVDEILSAVETRGLAVHYVMDTHTHADHLSGVGLLAERSGATAAAHSAARVPFDAERLADGQELELGSSTVKIIHSPGHTPDSLALLVDNHLFTGDALFVGGSGRTDFPGGSSLELFDSLRRFAALPEDTVVHPGHDYGGQASTTIGDELETNPVLQEQDQKALASRLDISGPPPPNMQAILELNRNGSAHGTIDPLELAALLELSEPPVVIDVRSASEVATQRLAESILVPLNDLEHKIAELPPGDLVLVCRSGVRAAEAQRKLAAHDLPARVLKGGINAWVQSGLQVIGSGGLSVERQTQLTIGTAVLTGSLLALTVSPWFALLPAFFGAGLMFAGASGTCGLAVALSRAPWNRRPAPESPPSSCAVGGGCSR